MKKTISKEAKIIAAVGMIVVALSFCSVLTAIRIGRTQTITEVETLSMTAEQHLQTIETLLQSIEVSISCLYSEIDSGSTAIRKTLEDTMNQMIAMNAVFLEYGKKVGILIQEDR